MPSASKRCEIYRAVRPVFGGNHFKHRLPHRHMHSRCTLHVPCGEPHQAPSLKRDAAPPVAIAAGNGGENRTTPSSFIAEQSLVAHRSGHGEGPTGPRGLEAPFFAVPSALWGPLSGACTSRRGPSQGGGHRVAVPETGLDGAAWQKKKSVKASYRRRWVHAMWTHCLTASSYINVNHGPA